LYFAPDAAKSHDYATPNSSGVRCLLLCKVLAGNTYKTKSIKISTPLPPSGYNSVLGEVSPGGLNYPELVVYTDSAVMVCYVVFYTCKS